jgi:hypothetical protein
VDYPPLFRFLGLSAATGGAGLMKKETSDFSFYLPQGRGGAEKRKRLTKIFSLRLAREK